MIALVDGVVFVVVVSVVSGAVFFAMAMLAMKTRNERTLKRIVKQLKDWRDDDELR